MRIKNYIRESGSTICVIVSLCLFFLSLLLNSSGSNTDHVAARMGTKLEKRISILDKYIGLALESDNSNWMELDDLPEDMVIYKYVYDTLQSWCNQFSTVNDDISSRLVFQRLGTTRMNLTSPLFPATSKIQYMNIGPKWYLVKTKTDDVNTKIIAGIEIKNILIDNLHKTYNGVNENLRLPGKFSVMPLNESGGSPVYLNGEPIFKIISETSQSSPYLANSVLRWIALIFIMLASVLYLWTHKRINIYCICLILLAIVTGIAYTWGLQMQGDSTIFSPTIYADGKFLNSFGALAIITIAIIMYVVYTYIIKRHIVRKVFYSKKKYVQILYGIYLAVLAACIMIYTIYTLKSLILNSNINLDLYAWGQISPFAIIVYLTYTGLLLSELLILQMFEPIIHRSFNKKFHVFTRRSLILFSFICATFFTLIVGTLGFVKEQNRVKVISNRLAVDRDLSLEIQLRNVEEAIANDSFIGTLSTVAGSHRMVLNRISENYLNRVSQNYDISVSFCNDSDNECLRKYEQLIFTGSPIADNSRFIYAYDLNDHSRYIGIFIYYSQDNGVSRMILDIEPKANKEDRGYYSILGKYSKPGGVNIPRFYSYAKYISGKIVSYKGVYAYPTILYNSIKQRIDNGDEYMRLNGYVHFINRINDDEVIVVSRKNRSLTSYIITFSYLFLIISLILFPFASQKNKKKVFKKNYYRARVNTVLFLSLFIALITMTIQSVTFVYKRNETNLNNMMSAKISTIQSMIESQCRYISTTGELNTGDFSSVLEKISDDTKSDITLYSPNGKVFRSTTPEIFEKMVIGSRINEDAYYNIKYRNQRFYIHPEQIGKDNYYSLYAPVLNAEGKMLAIIGTPYTDQSHDFKMDVLFHAATIITLFLILLFVTLFISTYIVNAMFKPLIEMGSKMNSADLHGLEYIIYKRDDEISTLVDAYNRMVHDLSESTKKLTQAERDMAWSEMARQVAHEIKNPLTPIKLEIQRLIRLKQKNDSRWEEKFDKVAGIILEHIDILTDTANEFSTFAKLYTEEPVEVDLDKTLRDQITIFDNKDNIHISYIGLEGATVTGPRPQLIRVFVNLITNAIQAIEIKQKEAIEDGIQPKQGQILICLRNGVKDGYYDIVFEDNGPGVNEENKNKLFTPNFTTKSGGTGLGLAICRNIIEKCEGTIMYQRSFTFKGACFTISLPKKKGA